MATELKTTLVAEDSPKKASWPEANYRSGFSQARCATCKFQRSGEKCAEVNDGGNDHCVCDLYVPKDEPEKRYARSAEDKLISEGAMT